VLEPESLGADFDSELANASKIGAHLPVLNFQFLLIVPF
jgi:hypothetical protein